MYDVTFVYGGSSTPALDHVSLKAEPGQTVALVGPSGSGKSTCARLAARLWDVDSGEITVGGVNIAEADPEVLLGEATASLDVENETKVQNALTKLLAGKTVLVIAHRMRTVESADHIVVLKEGKVAEDGTPQELYADENGIFRRMSDLQSQNAKWSV